MIRFIQYYKKMFYDLVSIHYDSPPKEFQYWKINNRLVKLKINKIERFFTDKQIVRAVRVFCRYEGEIYNARAEQFTTSIDTTKKYGYDRYLSTHINFNKYETCHLRDGQGVFQLRDSYINKCRLAIVMDNNSQFKDIIYNLPSLVQEQILNYM